MRKHWLEISIVALIVFNVADYFFTIRALSWGIPEGNPVMDLIVYTPLFAGVKVMLIPLALLWVWRVRHQLGPIPKSAIAFTTVVYGWLTGFHMWHQFIVG